MSKASSGEWAAEIFSMMKELDERLTLLEQQIQAAQKESVNVAAEMGEAGPVSSSGFSIRPISMLFNVRRAFYGYAMMLEAMGLSKNDKQLVMQLRNTMNMVIRLQQTIQMADVAMKAFYAGAGPVGYVMLALSAGTMIGGIVYGYRGMGG